jgi:hypothetical protein
MRAEADASTFCSVRVVLMSRPVLLYDMTICFHVLRNLLASFSGRSCAPHVTHRLNYG